jgi:uncharacterized membrane protein YhaH (DUF805 family)
MVANLFGISGRVGRGTWWLGQILIIAVLIGSSVVAGVSLAGDDNARPDLSGAMILLLLVAVLLCVVINISVTVKRYHDRGKSGFWFFINFVPFVGPIWQLIECGFCSGDDGDNKYGSPPGSERRMNSLSNEIQGMAKGRLAGKLDDNYIENYAKQLAMAQAQQQQAAAQNFGQTAMASGTARPSFGKR